MRLPLISETNEDKRAGAGGGGVKGTLIGFFTEAEVAGRRVILLKFFAVMDAVLIFQYLVDSILTISTTWSVISQITEPPFCWREVLSEAWTSGVVTNSTQKDWFCQEEPGRDFFLALGIHFLILNFYIHRCSVSMNLLYAFFPNVSISLRVKYCEDWIIQSVFYVLVCYLAFLVSADISRSDAVGLFTGAVRLSFTLFCMIDFFRFIQKIRRKEQEFEQVVIKKC